MPFSTMKPATEPDAMYLNSTTDFKFYFRLFNDK